MTTKTLPAEEFYKTLEDDDGFRCMDTWTHAMFGLTMRFAEAFYAAATEARVEELEEALRTCSAALSKWDEKSLGEFHEGPCELCGVISAIDRVLAKEPNKTLADLEAFLKDDPDDKICGV